MARLVTDVYFKPESLLAQTKPPAQYTGIVERFRAITDATAFNAVLDHYPRVGAGRMRPLAGSK